MEAFFGNRKCSLIEVCFFINRQLNKIIETDKKNIKTVSADAAASHH